ncbi:uncharacterized protein LOC117643876 isoform X1 [Thrips palmi]|uniref:Uncharacterized protein LOC117643876 isoform X1 n=1 Tax=Thrips palmi TaxID=161013 RepID=A0A6P8YGM8_THRPL|nr:uncharacterized protein LOC117643876 isoform X1 [Thrips palmi]
MASSLRMWALLLLSIHCLAFSTGQNEEPGEYSFKFDLVLGTDGEDVSSDPLDADSSSDMKIYVKNEEELAMIVDIFAEDMMTDKNTKDLDAPIDAPQQETKEPLVVRKEAFCLGCPTAIDLSIPENRNTLHKYLDTPINLLLPESRRYKSVTPTILSATKQVESDIKYAITFAIDLIPCADKGTDGEECSPLPAERHLCTVEFVRDEAGTKFSYNNCTSDMFVNPPAKAPESNESGVDAPFELTQSMKDEKKPMDEGDSSLNITDDVMAVENVRKRRSSDQGALRDIDKNEQDLVYRFAELAVRTLDEVDPDNNKRILLGVTEAKKQIVNGIMYHLVMQVGTSTCQENEEGHSGAECVENQLYPEKMCRVKILRSWADESPLNAKVVRCECADVWPEDLPQEPWSGRTRRSTQDNWPSTEGWKDYDLKDGSQSDCLEKVMTSFQDVLNVTDVSKVATIRDVHTRVNKETSQPEMVVTIVLTDAAKLKMMGDVKKPMVVSSRVVCTQRLKRSSGIPGGLSDADVNDPYFKEITNFGVSEIQKSVNSPYQHVLVKIIEAKRQVVAGTLFHYKIEIAPTSCLKTDQSSNQNCNATSSEKLVCTFKVWDQPWTKLREVKDVECGNSRSKREMALGGPQQIDVEDPYVKELAGFALVEIDKGLNSPYQQKVVRVVEAKTQVVAGTLMHLKLELATTNCLKSEKLAAENCVHDSDQPTTMCSLKVWDRSWLKKRELQDLQCGRTRTKREVSSQPTGPADATQKSGSHSKASFLHVDVDDLYIKSLAKYALGEMDKQTNSPYQHKLLYIVSSQVEHTKITRVKLNLYVTLSSCKKSSHYRACPVLLGAAKHLCKVDLFHNVVTGVKGVTSIQCDEHALSAPHNEEKLFAEENSDIHAELFRGFMRRFNKTYVSDEELQKRYNIFQHNLKYIRHMQDQEQGTARYGPTIFADLTLEEFRGTYLGLKPALKQENAIPAPMADIPNIKLPTSFDWREHNAVTPVKNQGACGSCWAFAVTGNLEGQYAIKHGKLLSLSEQELVDCDTLDDGCKGGLPDNAYHALEQLGGIELEKDYPYEGADEQCHFNSSIARVHVKSSVNITTNEDDMAKWLVKNGPIAIGINANAMQFYMGGVSHPLHFLCNPKDLDHGVLIVGFGVHTYPMFHKVLPFWVVKNSWGDRWGEQGYYRVFRGDGSCGVNQMASSALVD